VRFVGIGWCRFFVGLVFASFLQVFREICEMMRWSVRIKCFDTLITHSLSSNNSIVILRVTEAS
jgi:hypothetical protein